MKTLMRIVVAGGLTVRRKVSASQTEILLGEETDRSSRIRNATHWERRHPCRRVGVFRGFWAKLQLAGRDAGAPGANPRSRADAEKWGDLTF